MIAWTYPGGSELDRLAADPSLDYKLPPETDPRHPISCFCEECPRCLKRQKQRRYREGLMYRGPYRRKGAGPRQRMQS